MPYCSVHFIPSVDSLGVLITRTDLSSSDSGGQELPGLPHTGSQERREFKDFLESPIAAAKTTNLPKKGSLALTMESKFSAALEAARFSSEEIGVAGELFV